MAGLSGRSTAKIAVIRDAALRDKALTRPPHDIPTHFHPKKVGTAKTRGVERASYGPFLEVFARKRRTGWKVWGAGIVELD